MVRLVFKVLNSFFLSELFPNTKETEMKNVEKLVYVDDCLQNTSLVS